ncbi:MAG: uncharacterized protein A8A55_2757 [Amphiamblys sp. WSBS2006]|nr:MAG: uncharacterized protein A8A55_2757 [Amphiamblys sp. WSBS2006]
MAVLQSLSFRGYNGTFFVPTSDGIIVLPRTSQEYARIEEEVMGSLEECRNRISERRQRHSPRLSSSESVNCCSHCGTAKDETPDALLFPVCLKGDSHFCHSCLARRIREQPYGRRVFCSECGWEANKTKDYYSAAVEKTFRKYTKNKKEKRQEQMPVFSPETLDAEEVFLLDENTKVVLKDISVSSELFLVFLAKTNVETVGSLSLFKHDDNECCFKDPHTLEDKPVSLVRLLERFSLKEKHLVLENIEKIPTESIGCLCEEFSVEYSNFARILPKLDIREENVFEKFELCSLRETDIVGIFKGTQIFLGRVKKLELGERAILVLQSLLFHEENVFESVVLFSFREMDAAEHFKDSRVCLGKVKTISFIDYSISALPFLLFHEENVFEAFELESYWRMDVANIFKDSKVRLGKVKTMAITDYAIPALPFLVFHEDNVFELVKLGSYWQMSISRHLKDAKNKSIDIGKVRKRGLLAPVRIRQKLKYVIVDGQGNPTGYP